VKAIWIAGSAALALLGGLAALLSEDVRNAIADAAGWIADTAEWFYPVGVIVVLAVVIGVMTAIIVGLRRRLDQEREGIAATRGERDRARAERDRAQQELTSLRERSEPGRQRQDDETYRNLVAVLPREPVRFLRDHDFGGPWPADMTRPIWRFVEERNSVEDQFLDPELEDIRRRLHEAASRFAHASAQYGVPHRTLEGYHELAGSDRRRDEPPEGPHYERFEAWRQELGELADAAANAYDELVGAARTRLPLAGE
jgi:hypothetical protein